MAPFFFGLTLFLAVCDWIFTVQQRDQIRWITKPGTLLALIVWFSLVGKWQGPLFWFGLGLVFSFLGDAILLLPGKNFFPVGGGAFFLTHVFYILGFLSTATILGTAQASLGSSLLIGPMLMITHPAGTILPRMRQRIPQTAPFMYAAVIIIMNLSAISTFFRPGWLTLASILCCLGALLFLISDSVLAYARFKHPIHSSDLIVMTTYHTGQILIAAGALANFI